MDIWSNDNTSTIYLLFLTFIKSSYLYSVEIFLTVNQCIYDIVTFRNADKPIFILPMNKNVNKLHLYLHLIYNKLPLHQIQNKSLLMIYTFSDCYTLLYLIQDPLRMLPVL